MRIYNGKKAALDLPLSSSKRITVPGFSVSGNVLAGTEFLSMLVSTFKNDRLALIVGGPYEINMCSSVPGASAFVVQSLDEAVQRFAPATPKVEVKEEVAEESDTPTLVEEEIVPTEGSLLGGTVPELEDEAVMEESTTKSKKKFKVKITESDSQ